MAFTVYCSMWLIQVWLVTRFEGNCFYFAIYSKYEQQISSADTQTDWAGFPKDNSFLPCNLQTADNRKN